MERSLRTLGFVLPVSFSKTWERDFLGFTSVGERCASDGGRASLVVGVPLCPSENFLLDQRLPNSCVCLVLCIVSRLPHPGWHTLTVGPIRVATPRGCGLSSTHLTMNSAPCSWPWMVLMCAISKHTETHRTDTTITSVVL